jgi:hypothetical protein
VTALAKSQDITPEKASSILAAVANVESALPLMPTTTTTTTQPPKEKGDHGKGNGQGND